MQTAEIVALVALVIQLAVMICILPVSVRVTGSRLVAVMLFVAFASMFILRFVVTFPQFVVVHQPAFSPIREEVFALITSTLLLAAMFYIDRLFVKRRQVEEDLLETQGRFLCFADIRGHKGTLKVYSESGRGSALKLLLPCGDGKTPMPKPTGAISAWRGHGTILVVDDEESVRIVTARMLENFGFSVLKASDGREGVETFRKNSSDIQAVVLDMTMPHLNGDEAFREIRRINPAARVLLLSGYNEQDATDRFAGKGLAGFLQKPFRPDDLREKLRTILEKSKAVN